MSTFDDKEEPIEHSTVLAIASAANADPRTVRKRIEGRDVRGRVGERIDRACRIRGIRPRTPSQPRFKP